MRPMLATPTARPPRGDGWRHELKWDGVRALVSVTDGRVTIRTRSGADCTDRFPEITGSHLVDFGDLLLDGEMVALTDGGPDFRAVMHRLRPGGRNRKAPLAATESADPAGAPIRFVAFDVLRAAGHETTSLPWRSRRDLLEGADLEKGAVLVPPTHADGDALFAATLDRGIEGVVSKRTDSPYRPGIRSEDWQKSVHRRTDTFVVGGWRPVEGTVGTLGALLLGEYLDGTLRYRGRVGTGFSGAAGRAVLDVVTPSPHCPFTLDDLPPEDLDGTSWVRPTTLVDISYLDRSAGGRLRQPSYKGLRPDLGVRHAR